MRINVKIPSFIKSVDLPVNYSGTQVGKILHINKKGIATIEVFSKFQKLIKNLILEKIDIKNRITFGKCQSPICPFCEIPINKCGCNTC